jgi:hypothetical protein
MRETNGKGGHIMIRLLGIFLMLVMTMCMATTLLYTVQFGGANLSPIALNAAALERVFDKAPPGLLDNQDRETYMSIRCWLGEGFYCGWVSSDSIKTHGRPNESFPSVSIQIDRDLTRQLFIRRPDQPQLGAFSDPYKHIEGSQFNTIRIRCHRRAKGEKIQCQVNLGDEWQPMGIF